MSKDENIKFIRQNINSSRLTDDDRFEIATLIAKEAGIEKIKDMGPDCAVYINSLSEALIQKMAENIREYVKQNNEKFKNMYKNI